MPDRRETMGGYTAREKKEYPQWRFFSIPDYRFEEARQARPAEYLRGGDFDEEDELVRIPAHYEVCGTCRGTGSMVNPSIDSNGITGSEMEELGDDFREDYFSGTFDVTCSECRGLRVVLEADEGLDEVEREVLEAYEEALYQEGEEIWMHNQGIQF